MSCLLFARTVALRRFGAGMASGHPVATIRNDPARSRFYVPVDNEEAFLRYSLDTGRRIIVLEHTEVPVAAKGRGLGKLLAQSALDYASNERLRVQLLCEFTGKFYADNRQRYATLELITDQQQQ